ncbi:putative hydrolase [Helianthus annuus]|nr:putative hydrolase [Helianthus annuus]
MDLNLFDPKSVFMSNLIGQKGCCLSPLLTSRLALLSSPPSSVLTKGKPEKRVLDAFDDEYGGGVVNPEKLPSDTNVFVSILRSSLSLWRTEECFQYHHAEKGYIMMTYWIPDEPCMLPANASHQVGVGGFVMNDKNEVLVVQEKHRAPELAGLWKLPTGFILEWMALREFVEQLLIKGDNMFKKIIDMCIARIGKRYCGLSVHKVVSKFDNRLSSLYYNAVDDQRLGCSSHDSCSTSCTST